MDIIKTKWNVITGAPSSGKSATIKALKEMGYQTKAEGARELIEARQRMNHSLEYIFKDSQQIQMAIIYFTAGRESDLDPEETIFLESSPISSIAYAIQQKADVDYMRKQVALTRFHYYHKIFILDQLDIFEKDEQRIQDAKDAKELDRLLPSAYEELGYEVIRIPFNNMTAKDRAHMILSHIQKT